ncbi:NUDIX domain-containing protein [Mesorhizobium sp. B2-3-3]|nr:NUDIX domain-containing protein [Mesorhizobium sp. B2-3-3]
MEIVRTWTGRTACVLQAALRLTNEQFAEHLGISTRTIVRWHARPDLAPRTEMQQLLDTTLEKAGDAVRIRFGLLSKPAVEPPAPQAQALRVAIAVVVRGSEVLLVCRRGDDSLNWQFPAGMVKPGGSPEVVAAQETLAETGTHVAVRTHLGGRLHPVTGVMAEYFLCEHLAGEALNRDPEENVDATWVPLASLTRFIPADRIFPPILSALEAA